MSHEQMQVFQMITKSQRIFSHAQVATASSQLPTPDGKQGPLKPLQGPRPQQPPSLTPTVDSLRAGPMNPEPEGSPARRRKSTSTFPREASPGGMSRDAKGGPKVAAAPPALTASSLDPPGNPDISSLAKQLRSSKGTLDLGDIFSPGGLRQTQLGGDEPSGTHLPGKQTQAENGMASGATKAEKGPACSRGGGYRLFSGNSRAQRFSGVRKEKVKMDMCCAASPSQVAMASFSSAGPPADLSRDSKSKLTIFNRIQVPGPSHGPNPTGGRVWSLPTSGFLTCPGTLFNLSESSDAVVQRGREGSEKRWSRPSSPYREPTTHARNRAFELGETLGVTLLHYTFSVCFLSPSRFLLDLPPSRLQRM